MATPNKNCRKASCAFGCNGKMQSDATTLQSQLKEVLFKLLQFGPPLTQPHSVTCERESKSHRECGTVQPCHPRTWNVENEHNFSVARNGSLWLFLTFLSFFEWFDSGLRVARSGSTVARECFFLKNVTWLDSGSRASF